MANYSHLDGLLSGNELYEPRVYNWIGQMKLKCQVGYHPKDSFNHDEKEAIYIICRILNRKICNIFFAVVGVVTFVG